MIARIAQWIRSWTLNQRVVSSIPTLGTLVAPLGKVLGYFGSLGTQWWYGSFG